MPITPSHTYNIGIDIHLTQFSLVPRHTQTQNNHYIFSTKYQELKAIHTTLVYIPIWHAFHQFKSLFKRLHHNHHDYLTKSSPQERIQIAPSLFIQQLVQAHNKGSIKALHCCPL